jgi:RNA polymerase sigma-70 factor, ECF subfamily
MNPADAELLELSTHLPFVQRLARGLLGGDGDDVAQEAIVRAWKAPPRPVSSIRGWLTTMVGNLAHNQRRSAKRRVVHESKAVTLSSVPAVDDIVAREEVRGRVVAAVLELPPMLRDVVLLRFYEGLDSAAIGAVVGAPASTVRSRLQQGLARLRTRLDEQHGDRSSWAVPLGAWQGHHGIAPPAATSVALRVAVGWRVLVAAAFVLVLSWQFLPMGLGPIAPGSPPGLVPIPVAQANVEPVLHPEIAPARVAVLASGAATAVLGPNALWGRVLVASTNEPLAGAAVSLDYRLADELSVLDGVQADRTDHQGDTVTDADGRFRFAVARATQYRLRVVAPGFPEHLQVLVAGGSEVVVRMQSASGLCGRVLAAKDRSPLANIRVSFKHQGQVGGVTTRTAIDGSFFLGNLPSGPASAVASGEGLAMEHQQLELRPCEVAEVQFVLSRGRRITGTVTDAVTGLPVAGAALSLRWTRDEAVMSAVDGTYTIDGLGESEMVYARAPGYVAAVQVVPTQADAPSVDFALVRGGRVRGRIVDGSGVGLGNASVALARDVSLRENSVHTEWCTGAVDADGWFVIEDVGPASGYQLTARCAGFGARAILLPDTVAAAAQLDLGTIELRPEAFLEGIVVDVDGRPVPGADVHLFGADRDFAALLPGGTKITPLFPFAHRRTHTAGDGVFRIAALAAGDYALSVTPPGKEWSHERAVPDLRAGELRADLRIVVDRGRTVGGTIRVPGQRGLPDGCHMALVAEHDGEELHWAQVAADGRFTFERMVGVTYRLSAVGAPVGFALVPVAGVTPGRDDLEFVLAPAEVVAGQVLDGNGRPWRGVAVHYLAEGESVARSQATDQAGRFSIEVPPGAVGRLSASDPDQMSRQVSRSEVFAGEVDLVLRLP